MKGVRIRSVSKARSVYELLGSPVRWVRGTYFGRRLMDQLVSLPMIKWANNAYISYTNRNKRADCFCMIGAIQQVYTGKAQQHDAIRRVANVLIERNVIPSVNTISEMRAEIIDWNDSFNRTWSEVREVAKAAHV